MHRPSLPALLLAVPALSWSGWFLWSAFGRWRFERVCSMACGPFVAAEQADYYRRAFDWQTPLMVAALPFAALAAWHIAGAVRRRMVSQRGA